jgi:hypothetical protein
VSDTGTGPEDPGHRLERLLEEHRDPGADETPEAPAEPDDDPFASDLYPVSSDPDDTPARPDGGELGEGTAAVGGDGEEPGDGEEAGDGLPDAPLFALLRTIVHRLDVSTIDRVWIFPPRRLEQGETAVVVVSAFDPDDGSRRRVHAAHYTASSEGGDARLAMAQYGAAPDDRIGRVVEEVVDRLKEGPPGAPRAYPIQGDGARWDRLLHELAEAHLEDVRRDPRLGR